MVYNEDQPKEGKRNGRQHECNQRRRGCSGHGFALTEGEDQRDQLRQVGKASRRHERTHDRRSGCGHRRP